MKHPDDTSRNSIDQGAETPQGEAVNTTPHWEADIKQTLQLGEQLVGYAAGVIDLARAEALLALQSAPRLLMLWLLMMPIMLLAWLGFSVLLAWTAFALSHELGLAIATFFLLQVALLLVCRGIYARYQRNITFPYTREQINHLMRSAQNGFSSRSEAKE